MITLFKNYHDGANHRLPQIIAILCGSLAGLGSGLLMAWTSPSIPEILANNSTFNISFEEASYFTVIPPVSMALAAPLCWRFVGTVGRRMGVLLIGVPQLISWILIGVSRSLWVFYVSRIMSGIGDALLFATSPIYVCEIAEPSVRGTWGITVSISLYSGIFLINLIGAYNNLLTTAIICGCFPILHVIIFSFMPESPYFYLMKNKEKEAAEALRQLRWRNDVDEELARLKANVKKQVSEQHTFKKLFANKSNRRALIMAMGIRVAQQMSGLSAFEMYTQYMFLEAGGSVSEKTSAIIFSGTLASMVALSSCLMKKFGRRPLMMFSCAGCGIILMVEAIYFILEKFSNLHLSKSIGWFPLIGMLVYIVICATGLGILPTLILGEVFSANIKGRATLILNIAIAVCMLAVPKLFQTLTYSFGIYLPFCIFSASCFAGLIFSYFCVIETKGKTLEEIQEELKGNTIKS